MNRYDHNAIAKLRGHASWKDWHKAVLVYLDAMGLRYLLFPDLRALRGSEQLQYVADQRRAVQLLVSNMSEQVLKRLWRCGWEARSATLNNTLALLADLLAEPERYPQQSYETHRDIVDLARGDLVPKGFQGAAAADEFLKRAQQCHLRLLARYGGGNGSVEELLEHLFTSSVMEGLKAARPDQYGEWMRELDEGQRSAFVEHFSSLIKDPRLDSMTGRLEEPTPESNRERRTWDRRRARNRAKRSRHAWGLSQSAPHRKRRRGANYPKRLQEANYPDCYRPRYDDDA
ncbi:hypothetical protein ISF_04869 [Cordyceps fumosorosea ARSEF 2679]|uniref:Uncharacterized protein n=1 Tax=Cordyceps fumosorosea (strain ARSEF 2679) TaxID=1081104 RepID=A0A167VUJ4_CORFA|nr:hypothetical protein ISF_04869 [Cordyceps fumosorosea ARSEF 2679]OAA62993.1 hypothetical protein ISF_04869 [Cordyceps fumosorosea ARSEF 2679]